MPLRGRQKGSFWKASTVIAGLIAVSRRVYYAPKSAERERARFSRSDLPDQKPVNPYYSVSAVKEARNREKALLT